MTRKITELWIKSYFNSCKQ